MTENTPSSWNEAEREWNQHSKEELSKIFTADLLELGEEFLDSIGNKSYENNFEFAKKVSDSEIAIILFCSYKNSFNLHRYSKKIFDFLKDKSDFNKVVQKINSVLWGQKPYFNCNKWTERTPALLIKKDMKALKEADTVLLSLGFNDTTVFVEASNGKHSIRHTRNTLRDTYKDLEQVLEVTRRKEYKPNVLAEIDTKIINPVMASKYFEYSRKAHIEAIRDNILESFTELNIKFIKSQATKTTTQILSDKI